MSVDSEREKELFCTATKRSRVNHAVAPDAAAAAAPPPLAPPETTRAPHMRPEEYTVAFHAWLAAF